MSKIKIHGVRAEVFGWAMYDWANSAFSTIVVTTLLGPYLTGLGEKVGGVVINGFSIEPSAFFPACVSVSVLLQVVFLPLIGVLADNARMKKEMLVGFAITGSIATLLLYFIRPDLLPVGTNGAVLLGGLFFVLANFAFGASIVLCNAFLTHIASPEQRDRVSSFGWALGYLGGGIALAITLVFFRWMADQELAVRLSLAFAGGWWLLFTLMFPARYLSNGQPNKYVFTEGASLGNGFRQIFHTLHSMYHNYPETLKFLTAYLFYNDGIQTIIVVATIFASEELGVDAKILVYLIVMIQFVAFAGSLLFGWLAGWIGAKKAIMLSLFVWSLVTIYACVFLHNTAELFFMGAVVALVLGGSQALSRSLFSQLIPERSEAEYFAFYEISERGTSWIGPLAFSAAIQMTGSCRIAIFPLVLFFVMGLILLSRVNVRMGMVRAGNDVTGVII